MATVDPNSESNALHELLQAGERNSASETQAEADAKSLAEELALQAQVSSELVPVGPRTATGTSNPRTKVGCGPSGELQA